MKPQHYAAIDKALEGHMVTGPFAYDFEYNLPQWLPHFAEGATPKTLVIPGQTFDLDAVAKRVFEVFQTTLSESDQKRKKEFWAWKMSLDNGFNTAHEPIDLMELPGPRPVMLKDYLKSAKHQWFDACYIPDCRDLENVKRVTKNFLDVQGEHLTGGLCFREFIPGKPIGTHPKTRQPLVNEWRAFLKHGRVIYLARYWADGDYTNCVQPRVAEIEELCKGLHALPFVAVDLAEKEHGEQGKRLIIYEINDGGAAGIPDGGDVKEFYRVLHKEFAE
jgi:hypothetical protein